MPEAPAAVPSRFGRYWLVLAFVTLEFGLLMGMGSKSWSTPAAEAPVEDKPVHPALKPAEPDAVNLDTGEKIDRLLATHDYRSAIALCPSIAEPAMAVRKALALEGLGQFDKAIEIYRGLASHPNLDAEVAAARLGRVRCAVHLGRGEEAQSEAAKVVADAAHPAFGPHVLSEALCLHAISLRHGHNHDADQPSPAPTRIPNLVDAAFERWTTARNSVSANHHDSHHPTAPAEHKQDHGHDHHPSADEIWRAALAAKPRMPWTPIVNIELGNVEAVAGRQFAAITWYEKALLAEVNENTHIAAFNLGVARFRMGQLGAARSALLLAIDAGPNDHQAIDAWWWMARTWIDAGDIQSPRRSLQRVIDGSHDQDIGLRAAVALAACQLSAGEFADAHRTLAHHQYALRKSPHRSFAAILDAAALRKGAAKASPHMLEALLQVDDESPIGPIGVVLMGREFERAGFVNRMVSLYQSQLPRMQGHWSIQASMQLADYFMSADEWDKAAPHFVAVASVDRRDPGAVARLRLAEIALKQAHLEECIELCRTALAAPMPRTNELLKLMGQAYEQTGDAAKAAECYAGVVPGK